MITRREALWGTLRALGGAAIAVMAPSALWAREPTCTYFTRTYKGITANFTLENGWWVGRFYGREKEYGLKAQAEHWGAKRLWPTCKRTIDMHLRETGYVP